MPYENSNPHQTFHRLASDLLPSHDGTIINGGADEPSTTRLLRRVSSTLNLQRQEITLPPDNELMSNPHKSMTKSDRVSVAARFAGAARVRFEFAHSTAKRVFIAGSFNGWNAAATPMAPAGNGRWLRELWLPPGEHEYLVVMDGEWLFDPIADDYVPNVFGGMNAVVHVRLPAKRGARTVTTTIPSLAPSRGKNGTASATHVACFA